MAHTPVAPGSLPAGRILINGLRLPRTMMLEASTLPSSRPALEVLGRDGQHPTGRRSVGPRSVTLTGVITPDSVDAFLGALHAPDPVPLRLDSPTSRFLLVEPVSVSVTEVNEWETRVNAQLEAKSPFWQAHEVSSSTGSMSRNATRTVTVAGNAAARPVITITGSPTNRPRLVNETSGTSLELLQSLPNGSILTIDTALLTARVGANSVLESMSDAFALGFCLSPGDNTLRFESTSGNASSVTLTWRDQWH